MEITQLFYPQIAVTVGPYTFDQGVTVEVTSSKDAYFDWAKIRFTGQFQQNISLARKDAAFIRMGYGGVLEKVFTGFVDRPYNQGGAMNEISLKDDMLLLEETIITNTFLETTPQEMIRYFLAEAGVSEIMLSEQSYTERRRVPIQRQNVIQAINTVHKAWGISKVFFFRDGVFYWDELPPQKKVYTFEYGVNILSLARRGGTWVLETASAPFLRHSHTFIVDHPNISGEYQVSKVVFSTNDDGFIRTYIYF